MSWDLNQSPPTLNLGSAFVDNTSYNSNATLVPSLNCFLKGTKIQTVNGYVPVEDLKDGDELVTTRGTTVIKKKLYRKVSGDVSDNLPYRIPKDHFGAQMPFEDTYLSPLHCVFANGDWMCMYQTDFKQEKMGDVLYYYHLLTTDYYNDFIFCNGIVSESLKPTQENYELYKECVDEAVGEKL